MKNSSDPVGNKNGNKISLFLFHLLTPPFLEQGPKDGKTPKLLGHKQKQQQQQDKKPSQQQQLAPLLSNATKFLVKNAPNQPDLAQELKYRFDSISPYSKTLHFAKDDIILTFVKPEEARAFMEIVEKNPIIIGTNTLDFIVKTADKDNKTEKAAERQEKFDKFRNKLGNHFPRPALLLNFQFRSG